jgi:sirohydrochlorin ferrochelatase
MGAMAGAVTFLVDNGSLEPAATLALREIAAALAGKLGTAVVPVSLLHASAVPAEALGGVAAEIFEPALTRRLAGGTTDFVVLPLFFGPSRGLTDYLPERVAHVRGKYPALRVRVAAPLFQPEDDRLARILADHVRVAGGGGSPLRVALVDHGSPVRAVTAVRDALAGQLRGLLDAGALVAPCSMERRAGPDYAFNDPLLADLFAQPEWTGDVVVARQFLLPGRHAGPEGDVAQICRRAEAQRPGLHTLPTPLVGAHPGLIEILAARWRQAATPV